MKATYNASTNSVDIEFSKREFQFAWLYFFPILNAWWVYFTINMDKQFFPPFGALIPAWQTTWSLSVASFGIKRYKWIRTTTVLWIYFALVGGRMGSLIILGIFTLFLLLAGVQKGAEQMSYNPRGGDSWLKVAIGVGIAVVIGIVIGVLVVATKLLMGV